jgi:PAS domain-containing protein
MRKRQIRVQRFHRAAIRHLQNQLLADAAACAWSYSATAPELDHHPAPGGTALAFIHNTDHRLIGYNNDFHTLWHLDESWLRSHPSWSEILDRLRMDDKLPQPREFKAWKTTQLARVNTLATEPELWHLPRGMSLRVTIQSINPSTTLLLFEDVSERLRWERACRVLLRVQKSMLGLQDGAAAVFGPDGRMKSCNDRFARLCQLDEKDCEQQPHVRLLANRLGTETADRIGSQILAAIAEPDLSEINGHHHPAGPSEPQQIRYARLPDGTTLVQIITEAPAEKPPLLGNQTMPRRSSGSFGDAPQAHGSSRSSTALA